MGCGFCCSATFLILINIVYMIIGLVLLIAGIIFKVMPPFVIDNISKFLKTFIDSFKSDSGLNMDTDGIVKGLMNYMSLISVILIISGAIVFLLSLYIMISICCKSRTMIIVYVVLLSIIIAIQIIVVIIYAVDMDKTQGLLTDAMKGMIEKYVSFTATNAESFFLNILQIVFNCCGAQGYLDYNSAKSFDRTPGQTIKYGGQTYTTTVPLTYPISCCKFKDFKFVDGDGCIQRGESNNKDNGCTAQLFQSAKPYLDYISYAVGGLIGFQGLILILAIICVASLRDSGVKPY